MEIMACGSARSLLHTFVDSTVKIIDSHTVRPDRVWRALEQACHEMEVRW
jgi:hypothetical protein